MTQHQVTEKKEEEVHQEEVLLEEVHQEEVLVNSEVEEAHN
jgi:hypothetical protein